MSVDCCSTGQGETQSSVYFRPLAELKSSSVITKISRSHVISDHPGFDPNASIGLLVLHVQHNLDKCDDVESEEKKDQERYSSTNLKKNEIDKKEIVNIIGENLIDQYNIEREIRHNNEEGAYNYLDEINDDSTHKFITYICNDTKVCEYCNKKVRIKKITCYFLVEKNRIWLEITCESHFKLQIKSHSDSNQKH